MSVLLIKIITIMIIIMEEAEMLANYMQNQEILSKLLN